MGVGGGGARNVQRAPIYIYMIRSANLKKCCLKVGIREFAWIS